MGLSRHKKAPSVLFWHYYLIQLIGHFPMLARVEVAVSVVDHLHGIPDALRYQVRGRLSISNISSISLTRRLGRTADPAYRASSLRSIRRSS